MLNAISAFFAEYGGILLTGTRDTLLMVVISTLFAYVLGLPLGVALIVTGPHGIRPNKVVNQILGWIVNIGRSIPFIILMVAIMPFTKLVVGTKIGVRGAIVPLVVSAAPFIARMWRPPLQKWTPVWWKPPSPWAPPLSRSSGKSTCRKPSPLWCWAARSPLSPFWATPPLPAPWVQAVWVTSPCGTATSGSSPR